MKEKRKFTPISMRCSLDQFTAIRPKLENLGLSFDTTDYYSYLTNDKNEDKVIAFTLCTTSDYPKRITYETWNEKVFLEACGIETEETFQITKEQIKELKNTIHKERVDYLLNEYFPKAFEEDKVQLPKDFTGWVKDKAYPNFLCYVESQKIKYGFNINSEWVDFEAKLYGSEYPATHQEVEEALRNEAVRRGFKDGVYYKSVGNYSKNAIAEIVTKLEYTGEHPVLTDGHGGAVFNNGIWATILETKTRQEAEKLLLENGINCKIVD